MIRGRVGSKYRPWLAVVVAGLLGCLTSPALAAADWPFYGHDAANTRNAGSDGPSARAARTLVPSWSFTSTQGDFTGTPVVSGGVLVAGSNGGVVDALDAATGALLWSRAVGPQVNGSAAVANRVVYVPVNINETTGAGAPSVVALSLTNGTPLWQTTLDTQPGADVYGSPVVANGMVYIGTAAGYAENNLPDAHDRGSVVALNATTGGVIWKTYTVPVGDDGGSVWSTPAVDSSTGLVYVGTGNAYHAPAAATTDSILELNGSTGAILAHFQATQNDVSQNEVGLDADIGASPNLFTSSSGQALVGEGDKAGTYWAVARSTLAPVWHTSVGPGSNLGGILGSTAWDGTALYGPDSLQTETWSLSRGGAIRWTTTQAGNDHLGAVSVANGVVYSTDNGGNLTARSTSTGSLLATLALGAGSWGGVSISGGTVYAAVGTQGPTGYIKAFRPSAQKILLSPVVGGLASALANAGQPGLGAIIQSVNQSLLMQNGL